MTNEEVIEGTLAWCNEIRAEKGQEPLEDLPKGKRSDPLTCPCGLATGLYVDNVYYADSQEAFKAECITPLPEAVCSFVELFDEGDLPEYDERPKWAEVYESDE